MEDSQILLNKLEAVRSVLEDAELLIKNLRWDAADACLERAGYKIDDMRNSIPS